MINLFTHRKKIAIALLSIWGVNCALPSIAYALTSGPAQPETKAFQVAGVTDMVDLQTGDLKYNVPLLDIDGYPLNLSYQSGSGIDEEASWVGAGWTLNPGAINRQVRGVPDDFSGDVVQNDHYVKPKVTVGGKLTAKAEQFGIPGVNGSFTFGIFSDNYTGLGAEVGVNAGISYGMANDGALTAGLGLGVLSNTQSGVDASVSPYVSLSIKELANDHLFVNAGLSGSLGYNTRSGLKSLTLGESFGSGNRGFNKSGDDASGQSSYSVTSSSISYNTQPLSPRISVPFTSDYSSYSFDVGGEVFGLFASIGGTGYKNVRQVKNITNQKPAFGFLYAERGKDNQDAVMDFTRENDNPIIPTLPNLALPVPTPDVWSYTSQAGSGQFRLYRGGTGMFFDNKAEDASTVSTLGGDLGLGAWVHAGITNYDQHATTTSSKWTTNNSYRANGDFQQPEYTNPAAQQAYFRQVGEKNLEDTELAARLAGSQALGVATSSMSALSKLRNAGNISGSPAINITSPIKRTTRRPSRTMISYLTAAEAQKAGLYKNIRNYSFKTAANIGSLTAKQTFDTITRMDPMIRRAHHFSEMTVSDDGGKKLVYGIPAYNVSQDEYTFAINPATRDANHLVSVPDLSNPAGNPNGIDNYYHKEHKPAYATSYLLSAVLSPDYVDKTGNGITDDDLGTALKFNYSKLPYNYKWRTPYDKATPNRGLLADPDDDKGNIIYGEKEIWYVQSIESKTKIAYFITQDRRDALGVAGWQNGGRDTANKQKCLTQIRLYSKADMTRPIKVVKFQYTYELCRGIPNSADAGSSDPSLGGKLTLAKVWFEYGNADKGKYHPYTFQYKKTAQTGSEVGYGYQVTDRWGVYKNATENTNHLDNELYPYANQNKTVRDSTCALWQLNRINLPTGGAIDVSYESGDYAYVQDKKAMVMTPVQSLIINPASSTDSTRALTYDVQGLRLNISGGTQPTGGGDQTAWFKKNYLDGSDYIYTKLLVNVKTTNYNGSVPIPYDFVPTYCLIKSVTVTAGMADVLFIPITESSVTANPISISAWQRMKNEYPRYAYPGFDNRVQSNTNSVLAAVSAVVNAARNMSELQQNFYQKAKARNYATQIVLGNSFVKLTQPTGFKLGGQARVKKIVISDTWNVSSGSNVPASYGQAYSYSTTDNGKTISSGVATYEPSVGNDENALKQPVPYIEKIKGAINNYFDLELPFGESLYPAPAIGYSKVTVNDLDQTHTASNQTGYVVNEFYTAKDFPVKVTALPMTQFNPRPQSRYSLTGSNSDDELSLSQGYSIELNDMHGKPKATTTFSQSGAVIAATNYYYNAQDNGGVLALNNKVNVIDPVTLQVSSQTIGRDMDFFTDFREQETNNSGRAINIGGDVFPIPIFIPLFGLPHFPINENNDYKLFRSACAVKVLQSYGILSKVVKTQNGSSITTENLAYDALTGEALVTRTQNEFNKNIFAVNIPAYWIYKGMGGAYQNLGVLLSSFATNSNGEVTGYATYLQGGDEIVDTKSGKHYWIIDNQAASGIGNTKKLIDRDGVMVKSYVASDLVKIVKSGFHNMLTASTTNLVSLESPFTADNHLKLISNGDLTAMKVINASATTFDENWAPGNRCIIPPPVDPVTSLVKDTSRNYSLASTSPQASGAWIFNYDDMSTHPDIYSVYWGGNVPTNAGRRTTIGFWPAAAGSSTYNRGSGYSTGDYLGFDAVVTFPVSKVYYFALSSTYQGSVSIDCESAAPITLGGNTILVYPLLVHAGKHIVHCSFKLLNISAPDVPLAQSTAGLEIYNNTYNELITANSTGTGLNIIYSTSNFVGNDQILDFFDKDGVSYADRYTPGRQDYHYRRPDGLPPFLNFSYCNLPSPVVNPYLTGYLGNWRPNETKVFQQSRNYNFSSNLDRAGIDAKNAGYIDNFYAYWYSNGSSWLPNPNGSRWVTANTVTLYDKYGQQLENKDALGRYSAATFDFNGELPAAVASNAMNREIYAASLEDNRFLPDSTNTDTCNIREFIQPSNRHTLKQLAVNTVAHSGNYSALLPAEGVILSTIIDTVRQKTIPYLALDSTKQYMTQTTTGLYPNGFEAYPNKKYLFNAWVNDGHPNDKSIRLGLKINGNIVPLMCKAVVEGWKLLEGTMDLSTLGSAVALNVTMIPQSGTTLYVDDIRMHPFNAQLKSYAYDDKTMRLMAEIDENGFATFYEYDDEGLLVRVKKETEKGIMTLKETRSTYRRKLTP
jgi:hypothetical protein